MSNPIYKGTSQPITGNGGGLLGRLGSIFGGVGTPTYRGDGQPSPGTGGFFGAVTPRYKDTAKAKPADAADTADNGGIMQAPNIVVLDGDELAAGKIAIVVPRDMCAPEAIGIAPDACATDPSTLADGSGANGQQQ